MDADAVLPQGPVRSGGSGGARHVRRDPRRRAGAEQPRHGRIRRRQRRPATRSPSRPSSTSRWATTASSSTTRARSSSTAPSAWRRSSSTATSSAELLRARCAGRRHDPRDLLRRQGRDVHLVDASCSTRWRAARRTRSRPAPSARQDPAFLAENTGVVTAIEGPEATAGASSARSRRGRSPRARRPSSAKQFIEYMMGDGYEPWIAIAPEGKVRSAAARRTSRRSTPTLWATLPVGVDTKAPLSDFYGPEVLEALAAGPENSSPAGPSRRARATCSARCRASSRWPRRSTRWRRALTPSRPRARPPRRCDPSRSRCDHAAGRTSRPPPRSQSAGTPAGRAAAAPAGAGPPARREDAPHRAAS